MNLKLKMTADSEVSLVDRTDWLGAVTAVKTGKPCRHRELVGAHCMKYEYNYDYAQGNNSSTIRDKSVLECIGESIGQNSNYTIRDVRTLNNKKCFVLFFFDALHACIL